MAQFLGQLAVLPSVVGVVDGGAVGPDEAGVVVVGAVAVAGAAELGAPVIGADVALGGVGTTCREGRCQRRAVGRGHASLLAVLHTGHYKTVRGIAQL